MEGDTSLLCTTVIYSSTSWFFGPFIFFVSMSPFVSVKLLLLLLQFSTAPESWVKAVYKFLCSIFTLSCPMPLPEGDLMQMMGLNEVRLSYPGRALYWSYLFCFWLQIAMLTFFSLLPRVAHELHRNDWFAKWLCINTLNVITSQTAKGFITR